MYFKTYPSFILDRINKLRVIHMTEQILLVMAGGGVGSVGRYLVSEVTAMYSKGSFPLGTFIVNILGCFIIGMLAGYVDLSKDGSLLLVTGFCGGFTTFSSFSKETFFLLDNKKIKLAFTYVVASCILGILAVFLGFLSMGGSWY